MDTERDEQGDSAGALGVGALGCLGGSEGMIDKQVPLPKINQPRCRQGADGILCKEPQLRLEANESSPYRWLSPSSPGPHRDPLSVSRCACPMAHRSAPKPSCHPRPACGRGQCQVETILGSGQTLAGGRFDQSAWFCMWWRSVIKGLEAKHHSPPRQAFRPKIENTKPADHGHAAHHYAFHPRRSLPT
jgi:hypothetical protein